MGAYNGTQNYITDGQALIIAQETIWTNAASMLMASMVILVYFTTFFYNRRLVDRVTLRLTVANSTADLIYSAMMLWGALITTDGTSCHIFMWGFIEFTLLPLFLSVAIATNLCAVYVWGARQTQRFEVYYFAIPIVLSLAISVPLPAFHRFGWLDDAKLCWYVPNGPETLIWLALTYHLWIVLCVVILLIQVGFIVHKLRSDRSSPGNKEAVSRSIVTTQQRLEKTVKKVLIRVIFYPIVPMITQSLSIIVYMNAFANGYWNFGLMFSWCFFTAIQASLNALVFLFDPSVQNTWEQLKQHIKLKYKHEINLPKDELTRGQRLRIGIVKAMVGGSASPNGYITNDPFFHVSPSSGSSEASKEPKEVRLWYQSAVSNDTNSASIETDQMSSLTHY
ncbi:hypothetical protein K493DRAFT_408447 [Basidiobolus meristosporus CBS 931.73]|uniref:G-protein coupled receptors family 2 profile 2 domain-containing protein n=1 Tax=Basidiobolus meristosporus CBS 931.73 TaxID=1314790 RepID=A0A1Y1Y5N7_9FUNG|nr:hypothetical protein K493DRAFT_408447 [Basidiobolus meristosporus CBS 931.73]|eukprot:ORX93322.1 hypothetical protein K493DRAFT_408447 [Basidiobolus meristosporus CBS 931.73]